MRSLCSIWFAFYCIRICRLYIPPVYLIRIPHMFFLMEETLKRTLRTTYRSFILLPVMFALCLLIITSSLTAQSYAATLVQPMSAESRLIVNGYLVPFLQHRAALRSTDPAKVLQLSIGLRLRNEEGLNTLIAMQSNPRSSFYHHYITPQEFLARFAPDQSTVQSVTTYLRRQGFQVGAVSANHVLINASGSVASIERAFGTTIADYDIGGRIAYAPTREISMPASLAHSILSVSGLNNVAEYHSTYQASRVYARTNRQSRITSGYTPDKLKNAYNIAPLATRKVDGAGQSIAFFELDGYTASDVDTYQRVFQLNTPGRQNMLVDGASTTPGVNAIEVELDLEVASAIAPAARQLVYIGPNTTQGINDTYNRIVTDGLANLVSVSWGTCEARQDPKELQLLDIIFKQGAAQGQTFFVASGDAGAFDCMNYTPSVDSPADDPYVIGVGGTRLSLQHDAYGSEMAWFCVECKGGGPRGTGSGGGISTFFSRLEFQHIQPMYTSYRTVPDVSANADPATGYMIYCTVLASRCNYQGWITVGGTSAAAPFWAGVIANLNQYLGRAGKIHLGYVSPILYSLYNSRAILKYPPYHDVTSGNNLYYPAVTGYDLATGMGTPDVWNIARDLSDNYT